MSEQAAATDKATQESLISVHRWTDKLLTFRTTRPAGYRFTPGQFARLGLLVNGEMVWRAYSITSAETEDQLEYYAIIVPDGLFTSALDKLQPGDPVWVEKLSYGFMTPDRFADGEDFWMLATGTGLGPYISILQQREVWQQFRNLILVHCVRHENELTYQEKFEALRAEAAAQNLPAQLRVITMTTRDNAVNTAEPAAANRLHGRITAALRDGTLEKKLGIDITAASSRLMVCGNPEMITEVRELLKERGLGPCRRAGGGQFITEDYW